MAFSRLIKFPAFAKVFMFILSALKRRPNNIILADPFPITRTKFAPPSTIIKTRTELFSDTRNDDEKGLLPFYDSAAEEVGQ